MKFIKILPFVFLAVALIGFLDSVYLTAQHYLGFTLNCSIIKGCEEVLSSKYSTLGVVPVALLGTVFYLSLIVLTIGYLDTRRLQLLKGAAFLTFAGFIASAGLIYLQIFVIGSICLYCMISAASSTILFALGILILKIRTGNL